MMSDIHEITESNMIGDISIETFKSLYRLSRRILLKQIHVWATKKKWVSGTFQKHSVGFSTIRAEYNQQHRT